MTSLICSRKFQSDETSRWNRGNDEANPHLNSEMQKADEVVPASATNQKPKASRDGSGVAGRRDRQGRRGERLRRFGRANIGLAQSLL